MRLVTRARVVLARHPWIHWLVIGVLASGAGLIVIGQLAGVDAARREWADTRHVYVADHDLSPGDALTVSRVELPLVAIPPAAIDALPPDAVLRRWVDQGEVLVEPDLGSGHGPAALAVAGTVVVPVSDPLVPSAEVGLTVAIYAEGLVLTESATIVHTSDAVVFVAVEPDVAPVVAAAVQRRTASIAFTP